MRTIWFNKPAGIWEEALPLGNGKLGAMIYGGTIRDQIALNEDAIGDSLKFVKENDMVKICSHKGNVFAVEPPLFVELAIIETEPGFKGDTAQGATKPATVETGAIVYVPLFVENGDVLKIDTRTGEYLSRV